MVAHQNLGLTVKVRILAGQLGKIMKKEIAVIILAAGKSTRMKSATPKVLHKLCGRPMLSYVLDLVRSLKPEKVVAVLGHEQKRVREIIPGNVKITLQKKLIGTADAVKVGLTALKGFQGSVLILYGDVPLLKKATLQKLLDYHFTNNVDATLLTAQLKKPFGYGRIMRDKYSSICAIVEEKTPMKCKKRSKKLIPELW